MHGVYRDHTDDTLANSTYSFMRREINDRDSLCKVHEQNIQDFRLEVYSID